MSSVFYADTYHPIQSGSIDGTDILPHDNAVYRAHLCSLATLCMLCYYLLATTICFSLPSFICMYNI